MTAGRELDALVAEKVMGLEKELRIKGTTHVATCYTDNPYFLSGIDKDDVMRYCQPLPYSTSIEAAWLVVEKLKSIGHVIHVSVFPDKVQAVYVHDTGENDYGEADTAPHAICLAALKAMEVGK